MSRIPLTPLDSAAREVPGLEVAVGWDRPLATYFAIVSGEDEPGDEDAEDDADPVMLWLGLTYGETLAPASIIAAISSFAKIGRASGRTSGGKYIERTVGAHSLKKKTTLT